MEEGSAVGPLIDEADVWEFVEMIIGSPCSGSRWCRRTKCEEWTAPPPTGSIWHMGRVVTEKLELPSMDAHVAAVKWTQEAPSWLGSGRAEGLSPDPDPPAHRKWSVVALMDPETGKVFFAMVGHSFRLVSAVYNYNRRSAAITDILRRVFTVAAFNFYGDKYGFEPEDTAEGAFAQAEQVHWWLGAGSTNRSCSSAPTPRSWA